ncbi:Oxygen-regulated invasion protein orgA [Erwinia piriflorinigrans]|uniref:Oxygen-regulated invasion protein orgA n=1 Tax=Erwinia piriflorinigrans CFBP 5888 TaxID=1161919 RepID=V5Z741_9GAMM|nr:Oxygen-regulated invasion protein orgA [Erwinia piriflorinigrans]CCG87058.1 Oxygen-regulated invasion protein orgA [Erwinia piriflorinigrans CFBP 5888]
MFLETEKMLKILYSPVIYSHPTHLPDSIHNMNNEDNVLINYWLITHYQLKDLPAHWEARDSISLLILSRWELIHDAACMIGGYLLRCQLLKKCATLMSNPRLSSFISLPIRHHVLLANTENNLDTLSLGVAFVLSQIPHLPIGLKERVILILPAEIKLPEIYIARCPDHLNLLKMAINYAIDYK